MMNYRNTTFLEYPVQNLVNPRQILGSFPEKNKEGKRKQKIPAPETPIDVSRPAEICLWIWTYRALGLMPLLNPLWPLF